MQRNKKAWPIHKQKELAETVPDETQPQLSEIQRAEENQNNVSTNRAAIKTQIIEKNQRKILESKKNSD